MASPISHIRGQRRTADSATQTHAITREHFFHPVSAGIRFPGSELFYDPSLTRMERLYCALFGIPVVGLRIRLRRVLRLLPPTAHRILDAGCGRGVIARALTRRYPTAQLDALDMDSAQQERNRVLAERLGLLQTKWLTQDLLDLDADEVYDLVVSVDNLEHVEDDEAVLRALHRALASGGTLVLHVPHFYRRWPLFRWRVNFAIPGHVRPGYHMAELTSRLRRTEYHIDRLGFSYGLLEIVSNNLSYRISGGEQGNRLIYALAFPLLNAIAWLGQWSQPRMGAGLWVVARKLPTTATRALPE